MKPVKPSANPAVAASALKQAKTVKSGKKAKESTPTARLQTKKTGGQGLGIGEKGKVGRPTKKTPDIMNRICAGISVGKSARAMCIEVGIEQPTLWDWLNTDETFSKQYARSKEDCADCYADEIAEIADELPDGSLDPQVFNARQRLRVDARKWTASKLRPKRYGDKVDMNLGGQDGNPLNVVMLQIAESGNSRIKLGGS